MVDRVTSGRPDGDVLHQIAAIVGVDAALRLSVEFGGRAFYVPKKAPADSAIVRAIGEEAAERLARRFGGTTFMMPLEQGKRARIIALTREGRMTVREIAGELGCTERHVWQVRREFKRAGGTLPTPTDPDLNQLDIFNAQEGDDA